MEDGNPAAPPPRIGRYELRRELGRGMMGVVYEAHDPALRRTIALKTIELAFAVSAEERQSFIARVLKREVKPVEQLREDWQDAVSKACEIISADPGDGPPALGTRSS